MRPRNRMVVDGVDLYDEFGLVFGDDYELPLPDIVENYLDVPGRDGPIDLAEFSGDVRYQQRKQKFTFFRFDGMSQTAFEQAKTRLATFLHGKRHGYQLSIDPGYTYFGRLAISENSVYAMRVGTFVVKAIAEPYKLKENITYLVNAAGGITVNLPAGRMRVPPLIEVSHRTLVSKGDQTWELQPGASRIRDLYLSGPDNMLTINSYPEYGIALWSNYEDSTWAEHAAGLWSQMAALDQPLQTTPPWSDFMGDTWEKIGSTRWVELMFPAEPGDEYAAYFQFDWKDL